MSIGAGQIALIILAVIVLFGAGKIPRVMADMAKGIKAFKQGISDEEGATQEAVDNDPKHVTKQ